MLSIVIMDDDGIREVNRTFLRHDYATDIITFPLEESPMEAELLIGAGVLRRQAKEYRVSVRSELARLIIHGVLHLTGFDDTDEASRTSMKAREDELLALFLEPDRKSA
jgi:rRNA maturation RNase YbeY